MTVKSTYVLSLELSLIITVSLWSITYQVMNRIQVTSVEYNHSKQNNLTLNELLNKYFYE
jgi:hypothetical protein